MKTNINLLFVLLCAFSLTCCRNTSQKPKVDIDVDIDNVSETNIPTTLHGTFRLIQDINGQKPNENAIITINFRQNGTFTFKAEMPNQTLTDQGTYTIEDNILNISFNELEQEEKSGIFTIDKEGIAILPFLAFSDDDGTSEWIYVPDFPNEMPDVEKVVRQAIAEAKANFDNTQFDSLATSYSYSTNCSLAEAYYTYSTICYFANKKWETLYNAAKASLESKFNPVYINNLCAILLELNQLTNAKVLADHSIKHSSGFASAWGNLAYIYYQIDNLTKAEEVIDSALYYEPNAGIFHYIKAKIEEEQGKTGQADESFGQAWENGYAGSGREGAKPAGQRAKKPAKDNTKEKEKEEGVEKWAGRYQAKYISAASGETVSEANTQFGSGLATTNVGLQTLACVKEFDMVINQYGSISGTGEILYVYNGSSSGLASSALGVMTGGAGATLKNGSQTRKWSFSGNVDKDGNVTISGLPSEQLDLYNVGKWQKIDTWSPLLPDAPGAAMRGPFHLQMVMTNNNIPVIAYDEYMALNDKLIKQVHYRAFILRSSDNITPECRGFAKPEEKEDCPATEYISTQIEFQPQKNLKISRTDTYTQDGHKTKTESSLNEGFSLNDNLKIKVSANQNGKVGCSMEVGGIGLGQTGLGLEGGVGLSGSGELSGSIGVGLNLGALDKIWGEMTGQEKGIPIKPKMSLRLIYDPKCGFGVKGSVGGEASVSDVKGSATATGVIFFNKGL